MAGGNYGNNYQNASSNKKIYRRKQFRHLNRPNPVFKSSHAQQSNTDQNHMETSPHQAKSVMISQTRHQSSSHNSTVTPPTVRTLNFDNLAITTGLGFNLLCKAGWTPGQALGPSSSISSHSTTSTSDSDSALSVPLPIVLRHPRIGVGALPSPSSSPPSLPAPATPPQPIPSNSNRTNRHKRVHPRSRKNDSRHNKPRFSKQNARSNQVQRLGDNSTAASSANDDALSHSELQSAELASTNYIVQHLSKLEIFDPLRPHCPYDSNHIVRDLKALRKHVKSCPANPDRTSSSPFSPTHLFQSFALSPQSLETPSEDLDILSCSSVDSPCSSLMSDSCDYEIDPVENSIQTSD